MHRKHYNMPQLHPVIDADCLVKGSACIEGLVSEGRSVKVGVYFFFHA